MKNIVRSQLYQLVCDKAIFLILLMWALLVAFPIPSYVTNDFKYLNEPATGSYVFGCCLANDVEIFGIIITALIFTKDFSDRTIDYDILAGHSRTQVFFSRFLLAFLISGVLGVLFSVGPLPLVYTIKNGWGNSLSPGNAAIRLLLILLATFRICAETALFAMFFKRKGVAYFLFLPMITISPFISDEIMMSSEEIPVLKKVMPYLTVFGDNLFNEIINFVPLTVRNDSGDTYMKFIPLPEHIPIMLFMSAGLGIVMLITAYRIFARKDME